MQKRIIHLVARTLHPYQPFNKRLECIWIWRKLQEYYPHCFAAILMPNHLHLVIETNQEEYEHSKLRTLIGLFSRRFYLNQKIWQTVPKPEQIPDQVYLQRMIRYVHLNPCRKKLINDPLNWEFSTHRDWLGMSYPSWITEEVRKSAFRTFSPKTFHSYVSSDPACKVEGTQLPINLNQNRVPLIDHTEIPLKWILRATCLSLHQPMNSLLIKKSPSRVLAIHIASESKLFYPAMLATELGMSRQSIYHLQRKSKNLEAIQAIKRTLCDPRIISVESNNLSV